MLGKIYSFMVIISFICAGITGNMADLGTAAIDGAFEAVKLTGSMLGVMCLWSGIARVLQKAGFTAVLSKILMPFLKFVFPKATKDKETASNISASFCANILGLGNAALPLGIKAMESMKRISDKDENTASGEMITFSVLNTTPFQLIPATLMAMRNAYGCENPSVIVLPIWLCSLLTTVLAVAFCKIFDKVKK